MANQIEKEENEISEKNKIFSTQEEKIKSMEIESKGTISISVKEVTFSLETPLLATPGKLIQFFPQNVSFSGGDSDRFLENFPVSGSYPADNG